MSFTLDSIKTHISGITHGAIAKVCNNDLLGQLKQPEGVNLTKDEENWNVRMDWHTDEAGVIDGLFMRMMSQTVVDAFIIRNGSYDNLTFMSTGAPTAYSADSIIHVTKAKQLFECMGGTPYDQPVTLNRHELKNPELIKPFFNQNQDMLPEWIREQLFPHIPTPPRTPEPTKKPTQRPEEPNKESRKTLYLGIAVLLVAAIVFVAKRSLDQKPR